jgi:hypothetical protein
MSFLAGIAGFKKDELKQTTTVVRHLGGGSSVEIVGDGEERKQPERTHHVLFVSKYSFAFDKWISRKHVKVLLTSTGVKDALPLSAKSAYKVIEGFDNFEVNGLVELRALQLHAEHKFTHVVALSEEDLIRAGVCCALSWAIRADCLALCYHSAHSRSAWDQIRSAARQCFAIPRQGLLECLLIFACALCRLAASWSRVARWQ